VTKDLPPPLPEREQTNESLRTEREKSDDELLESRLSRELDADHVIRKAREQADSVLGAARGRADEHADGRANETADEASAVSDERGLEDEAVRLERGRADDVVRRERLRSARALSSITAAEREKTDLDLLTERARSDDALAHRDDFLGMVSHDLRNLLNGIVLNAASLADGAAAGEAGNRVREKAAGIRRYSARMNRLIGDLVDVASIDAGKLAFMYGRESCTGVIDESLDTFRPIASEKNISLTRIEGPSLDADFDRERLLQVLANLITNSIKFTSSGGRIAVRVERKGDDACFSVRDTGSGIPAAMRERIFERFWQVGTNDRRGLGLGLYISRCIVEAHGGRIWAESREGEGSEIFFTIPITAGDLSPAPGIPLTG